MKFASQAEPEISLPIHTYPSALDVMGLRENARSYITIHRRIISKSYYYKNDVVYRTSTLYYGHRQIFIVIILYDWIEYNEYWKSESMVMVDDCRDRTACIVIIFLYEFNNSISDERNRKHVDQEWKVSRL